MRNRKIIAIVFIILLIAVLSGWLVTKYFLFETERAEQPLIELTEHPPFKENQFSSQDRILVKIFYPAEEGMTTEEREVQSKLLPVEIAEVVIAEYLKGLKGGLSDTKLLGVYRDRSNIMYIDLSDEFRRNFSGDARQEFYLLKSLFETVAANITIIDDVKLLIEGKEIGSIGGHFYSLYGLKGVVGI
jgi:hypothetical protein